MLSVLLLLAFVWLVICTRRLAGKGCEDYMPEVEVNWKPLTGDARRIGGILGEK